ncbi:MAG: preprotein translocase subunit YajC [Leucobacter sp.]|nr:preprotein translocase subunit YajC [Leucobacter sp.]
MQLDPMTIVMFGLIAVLIIFMIRNGRKRQQAAAEMQSKLQPGAEVMLQSGIYGTVEEVDEAENRVTLRSGTSTFVVHRNAVAQIVTAVEGADEPESDLAPDDDPEFGERIADADAAESTSIEADGDDDTASKA